MAPPRSPDTVNALTNNNKQDSMLIRDIWITKDLVPQIAAQTCSHKRTVEKWMKNGEIPEMPYRLLELTENGKLGHIH